MPQKMLIDASHNEETRVVVLESKKVEDFDFESLKKLQLSGNIYLAKVTRVEPSLQAAFLDYGGNRHGFLAFSEIHPDYYQIPLEERLAIENNDEIKNNTKSRKVLRSKDNAAKTANIDSNNQTIITGDLIVNENIVEPIDTSSSITKDQESELTNSNNEVDLESTADSVVEELNSDENFHKRHHRKFRIQEVIKVRQILLIQIVKEERGNKGAALTTYLSLAGRYCVLMPNTPRGGGISRKITNIVDRKKLKEIANSLLDPDGSGLIIRTAGSNRTKLEIKRDYEYLIRQWEQVRDLTLSSIAPTTIYEEGSLIKRAIRDLYSRSIDEIMVEGDRGYREAKDYMKMLMPSHAKNVKKYENPIPLFTKFQVEDHLAAMFNPIAQLKSGGYIVINVTEALVAVDVNSGRATKETSIEDTALKTNLEAADELSRQIKLRDLAGLIVIDFIDMEDRKNNIAVEKRMKDRLKNDRARTQIGRISIFGLLEMSRQRLRPGMIETSTQACEHCHGTGITRSDDSMSLAILRELEEEGIKNIYKVLSLKTPINIANYILNEKRDRINTIETRYNLSIKVEAVNNLISPDYKLEKIKGDNNSPNQSNSIKIDNQKIKDDETIKIDIEPESIALSQNDETGVDESQGKRRRRRRRRPKQKVSGHLLPNNDESTPKELTLSVSDNTDTANKSPITGSPEKLVPQPLEKLENTSKQIISRRKSAKSAEKKTDGFVDNTTNVSVAKVKASALPKVKSEVKTARKPTAKIVPKSDGEIEKKSDVAANSSKEEVNLTNDSSTSDNPSKRRGWWSRSPKKD